MMDSSYKYVLRQLPLHKGIVPTIIMQEENTMFKYAILSALLFLMGTKADAQVQPPKLVTPEKYEETLKHYTSWHKNLSTPDFYEKFKWKIDKEDKNFSDLTDFEKDQFYLVQGFQLTKELHILSLAWQNELNWLKSGRITNLPEGVATAEDVTAFQTKLLTLRKALAPDFEKLMDNIFEKHKKKISEKERSFVKKQIVNFHDENKLIERKDDS
jgi:hypothetical protein